MGHYDEFREGYCPRCGAAPGNIIGGWCEFCTPQQAAEQRVKLAAEQKQKSEQLAAAKAVVYGNKPTTAKDFDAARNTIRKAASKPTRAGADRAVRKLVNAEIAKSWMGSKPPEEHAAIMAELQVARLELDNLLDKVFE